MGQDIFCKDVWNRYWGRAGLLLANFSLSPVTVPEVFAKVNLAQFRSSFYSGEFNSITTRLSCVCQQHPKVTQWSTLFRGNDNTPGNSSLHFYIWNERNIVKFCHSKKKKLTLSPDKHMNVTFLSLSFYSSFRMRLNGWQTRKEFASKPGFYSVLALFIFDHQSVSRRINTTLESTFWG